MLPHAPCVQCSWLSRTRRLSNNYSPAQLLVSVLSAWNTFCICLVSASTACFSLPSKDPASSDHLASAARHTRWPQTPHPCSSCTWESRADPGGSAHLRRVETGKAPDSGAENKAGNHCIKFSLHGNNKKSRLLSQLLDIIPTVSDHLGWSLKTVTYFLPYFPFLSKFLL